mgnify:FL=1
MRRGRRILFLLLFALLCTFPCACATQGNVAYTEDAGPKETVTDASASDADIRWDNLKIEKSMELSYATQFSVDYYTGGYKLISICDIGDYLLVPDGKNVPAGLPSDITVIDGSPKHVYLAATSGMDFIVKIGCLDRLSFSGTKEDGWYIPEAKQAMQAQTLAYAGKYNAPDVEQMLAGDCDLAIESTMILHNPEVKEQLEMCGIPVIVEHSSYETDPLGRLEWVKFYGALFAEQLFETETTKTADILTETPTGKTVAFFYVTTNGGVNVRKSGDYVSKMIELAGGTCITFDNSDEENALSTMTIQMETFYEQAKDADYIIYNSTIDSELTSVSELLQKNALFADFKAVKEGHVYGTGKNMFQETTGYGTMIADMHAIFTGQEIKSDYFYKLTEE